MSDHSLMREWLAKRLNLRSSQPLRPVIAHFCNKICQQQTFKLLLDMIDNAPGKAFKLAGY